MNESITDGFLIYHDLTITELYKDVMNKLNNDEIITDEELMNIKRSLYFKLNGLYTIFDDETFINLIHFDNNQISAMPKYYDEMFVNVTPDKYKQIVKKIVKVSKEGADIITNKLKMEIEIYKYLLLFVIRNDSSTLKATKWLISNYIYQFSDQLLSNNGICAVISLKVIRNVIIENLHEDEEYYNLCVGEGIDTNIKSENDLYRAYITYVKLRIDNKVKSQSVPTFENRDDYLYDVMFNNYRLVGQDKSKAMYNYLNYVISSYKRTKKFNILPSSANDYYHAIQKFYTMFNMRNIVEFMSIDNYLTKLEHKLLLYPYVDFETMPEITTTVLKGLQFQHIDGDEVKQYYTFEEVYNSIKDVEQFHDKVINFLTRCIAKINRMMMYPDEELHSTSNIYETVNLITKGGLGNIDEKYLHENLSTEDIKIFYGSYMDSIFVKLMYYLEMNHYYVQKVMNANVKYFPLAMIYIDFKTMKDCEVHAYVKIINEGNVHCIDPNMLYPMSDHVDVSICDIKHDLNKVILDERQLMFFGGNNEWHWWLMLMMMVVIVIIVVMVKLNDDVIDIKQNIYR